MLEDEAAQFIMNLLKQVTVSINTGKRFGEGKERR